MIISAFAVNPANFFDAIPAIIYAWSTLLLAISAGTLIAFVIGAIIGLLFALVDAAVLLAARAALAWAGWGG